MRLQPNCSELVFWLDELDEMDVDPVEILLAAADKFPLLRNEDSEDELEFWVFSTMEEKERAAQILAQTGSWEEFWDQLCKEKIYPARLWLRDRRAIFYHQHSQPQGYPVIRWLEEKLGIEVQPYDGGHSDYYEEWKRNHATV